MALEDENEDQSDFIEDEPEIYYQPAADLERERLNHYRANFNKDELDDQSEDLETP